MIGTLEIYKGYLEEGVVKISDTPILIEKNMIVEGGKEHVVDLLTRYPSPSGIKSKPDVSATYNVSNFTIQALSISPNESAFSRFDALRAASGYINPLSGNQGEQPADTSTVVFSSLWRDDGYSYARMDDIPNFDFTSVNSGFSGASYINGVLENVTFSAMTNLLHNPTFKYFTLDRDLSASYMNSVLGLVDLSRWTIKSCLRYNNELSEYSSGMRCGSLARENILDISLLSSLVASGYSASDDGVLYIRSFASNLDGDTSGSVKLKQLFVPAVLSGISRRQSEDPTLSMIAEITAKMLAVSGRGRGSLHQRNIKRHSRPTPFIPIKRGSC